MLCSVKELDGCDLVARDGEIGTAKEVYFDDGRWVIRHLVADTGGWLSGRRVLISPHAIASIDLANRKLAVSLNKQQVTDAPGIETDKPISRQHEISYYDYYGYPYYWSGGSGLWGLGALPLAGEGMLIAPTADPLTDQAAAERNNAERESMDSHLRSSAEVTAYDVQARDGAIGHIDDFIFDDRSWQIRYVVVDMHNWLPDRLVLLTCEAIEDIDWVARRVKFKLTREAVETSPPYQRKMVLGEEEQARVQRHFEGWQ